MEANANENTLIIFTFDELSFSSQDIMYKKVFVEKMLSKGYKYKVVMNGEVRWLKLSEVEATNIDGLDEYVAAIRIDDEIGGVGEDDDAVHPSASLQRSSRHHLLMFYKDESSLPSSLMSSTSSSVT